MTVYEECAREALVAFGPILLACLAGAVGWIIKTVRRERKMWKEAWDEG